MSCSFLYPWPELWGLYSQWSFQSTSKALSINWEVFPMQARLLPGPIAKGKPTLGTSSWRSFLVTIWEVSIWVRNTSIYPKKLSLKTTKYFYPPLWSQACWSLIWIPSWVKVLGFGFTWVQTWHLAETSWARLYSAGITYLGLSNSVLWTPDGYSLVARVLPVVSGRVVL